MRILVVSDIHANLMALEAVIDDAGEFDRVWCLGDVVGYGPDPNDCVNLLRKYDLLCLAGNHDWAALGKLDLTTFNADARDAVTWTQRMLAPAVRDFLESLPSYLEINEFTLAHASPRQPLWEYILDPLIAAINFNFFPTPFCLVGHTHTPVIYELKTNPNVCNARAPQNDVTIQLSGSQLIINPGSVGQPRDSDPRAAYGILDTGEMTWVHRRVEYSIEETQNRMRQHALPHRLVTRLKFGW
ncbi:MAG: metallophosphoesterase family protein [Anaerolineales bacterium]|nr:metallophosphoesterase family protein [Anaerolineales bacterium]